MDRIKASVNAHRIHGKLHVGKGASVSNSGALNIAQIELLARGRGLVFRLGCSITLIRCANNDSFDDIKAVRFI